LRGLVRHGRDLPALALACLWVFGVIVAPVLHLALHASLASHSHATIVEHDGHRHTLPRAAEDDDTRDESPTDHGRGSPLHGDVAALFPAPAFVLPPFVAIGERAEPTPLEILHGLLPPPQSVARGPPTQA